jgi:methionyl-tRNA formyltransferase
MKILLLGPARPELENYLKSLGDEVIRIEEKITADCNGISEADFLVSYGYRHILKSDVLNKFKNKAINLHISFLPWNKGADPNLWSFLEDTPKGVTIHYIDSGIDTGDILAQREVRFSLETDTLRSTYNRLSEEIMALFKETWPNIREGKIRAFPQQGKGSYHRSADKFIFEHLLSLGWDTPISQLIGKATMKKKAE